jgi:hypothetical protein
VKFPGPTRQGGEVRGHQGGLSISPIDIPSKHQGDDHETSPPKGIFTSRGVSANATEAVRSATATPIETKYFCFRINVLAIISCNNKVTNCNARSVAR